MVKMVLGGLQTWSGGDMRPVVELARRAEAAGIDGLVVTDHVVMGEHLEAYPYGPFPMGPEEPWFEPLICLASIAAATTTLRLMTGILVAPLRPAVLLAKQLATLDVMSGGRLDIGVGTGWQKEEYEACGVAFEDRFALLEDHVRVWRLLWGDEAPASYRSDYTQFERIWCRPAPLQAGGIPVWFGTAPLARNVARMGELADGWMPMEQDPVKLAEPIARIRAAVAAAGRDPGAFKVRAVLRVLERDGKADLEASLAQAADLVAAGVTHIEVRPSRFLASPDGLEPLLARLVETREALS
ncbi:MAG: fmn-dependent monooxygenase [Caulobacter sp.]|nr:fmn-dependent monooxygenase [Caulobacter sp.]